MSKLLKLCYSSIIGRLLSEGSRGSRTRSSADRSSLTLRDIDDEEGGSLGGERRGGGESSSIKWDAETPPPVHVSSKRKASFRHVFFLILECFFVHKDTLLHSAE